MVDVCGEGRGSVVPVYADSEVEGTSGDSTIGELETANGLVLDGVEILAKINSERMNSQALIIVHTDVCTNIPCTYTCTYTKPYDPLTSLISHPHTSTLLVHFHAVRLLLIM